MMEYECGGWGGGKVLEIDRKVNESYVIQNMILLFTNFNEDLKAN